MLLTFAHTHRHTHKELTKAIRQWCDHKCKILSRIPAKWNNFKVTLKKKTSSKKNPSLRSRCFHPRDARIISHKEINRCTLSHK